MTIKQIDQPFQGKLNTILILKTEYYIYIRRRYSRYKLHTLHITNNKVPIPGKSSIPLRREESWRLNRLNL